MHVEFQHFEFLASDNLKEPLTMVFVEPSKISNVTDAGIRKHLCLEVEMGAI